MDNKLVFEIIKNGLSDLYRRTGDKVPEELVLDTGSLERLASLAEEMAVKLEQGSVEPNSISNVCSIFNRLNGNVENKKWPGGKRALSGFMLYPESDTLEWSKQDYQEIREVILSEIQTYREDAHWVNAFLNVLEDELMYIPALRGNSEISLYEHIKTTAAVGSCLARFGEKQTEDTNMFLLFSMDVSGIQDFIYTISSKGALKSLRSRSFYLEIMMEHMVDELLEKIELTRANLIYSGGGHCYILFPNTDDVKNDITNLMNEINHWFLINFKSACMWDMEWRSAVLMICAINLKENMRRYFVK